MLLEVFALGQETLIEHFQCTDLFHSYIHLQYIYNKRYVLDLIKLFLCKLQPLGHFLCFRG